MQAIYTNVTGKLGLINAYFVHLFALFGYKIGYTRTPMKDFFKYLTVGEEDKTWGLYLNVAGKSKTEPHAIYPATDHPSGYYFHWSRGRVLQEFQLIYITEGSGIFESESQRHLIQPGVILLLRPGVRHRYRPNSKTGWVENYIGFNGTLAHTFLSYPLFQDTSIIVSGIREELIDTYYKMFDLVKAEEPGFQPVASGMIVKLLGYLISLDKKRNFSGKHLEQVIQKVRFQMREQLDQKLDLPQIAAEHHMGYAHLRKMFKKYTGVSPHQYHLELKMLRAKELILTSDKSIKTICFELGFNSLPYFSRLFKQKTGMNPSALRRNSEVFDTPK